MLASHNLDYSCVITGSSVHNERVERLWRDVNRCVSSTFSKTMRDLERNGLLDPLNETDMYCLHHIFLPRINKCAAEFQETWNNHALSSEGNMTPYQLYFEGLNHINSYSCGSHARTNIDVSGLDGDRVVVPRIKFAPCTILQQNLNTLDPLQPCSDNGASLYVQAVHVVGQHLTQSCSNCMLL